jgi:hypothetical protein
LILRGGSPVGFRYKNKKYSKPTSRGGEHAAPIKNKKPRSLEQGFYKKRFDIKRRKPSGLQV